MRYTTFWAVLLLGVGPFGATALAQYGPYEPSYDDHDHDHYDHYSQHGDHGDYAPPPAYDTYRPRYDNYGQPPAPPYRGGPVDPYAPQAGGDYHPPASYDPYSSIPGPAVRPEFHRTGGQISALADQLVGQAEAFLQAFAPKIGIVPEAQQFMADATALRNSAARLSQVAAGGAPPQVLAAEFGTVAASWQRFEGRMARVSKGRIGPNIATSLQMGGTVDQIGRLLP